MNDFQGRHAGRKEVFAAIASAAPGEVTEGAVGAGTGMTCYGFKGGIGTASRLVSLAGRPYTLGVLVVSNFGVREHLTICGAPVGRELARWEQEQGLGARGKHPDRGSIMMVLATDAPLECRQLYRVCRRAPLGLALTGSAGGHGSGDYVIAFSTTRRPRAGCAPDDEAARLLRADESALDAIFLAARDAVAEAVWNSLTAAETLDGRDGHVRHALPLEETGKVLRKYGVLG